MHGKDLLVMCDICAQVWRKNVDQDRIGYQSCQPSVNTIPVPHDKKDEVSCVMGEKAN